MRAACPRDCINQWMSCVALGDLQLGLPDLALELQPLQPCHYPDGMLLDSFRSCLVTVAGPGPGPGPDPRSWRGCESDSSSRLSSVGTWGDGVPRYYRYSTCRSWLLSMECGLLCVVANLGWIRMYGALALLRFHQPCTVICIPYLQPWKLKFPVARGAELSDGGTCRARKGPAGGLGACHLPR